MSTLLFQALLCHFCCSHFFSEKKKYLIFYLNRANRFNRLLLTDKEAEVLDYSCYYITIVTGDYLINLTYGRREMSFARNFFHM